ncbi:MAG: transglutaminase-like domain-containing protein [Clostridiaceae bacterium]
MEKRSTAGRLQQWIPRLLIFGFICLFACSKTPTRAVLQEETVSDDAPVALAGNTPAADETADKLLLPEASGTVVYEGQGVTIDASHTDQGYVMIRCEQTEKRLKARVSTSAQTYYYDLPSGEDYSVFPLQMGDGDYTLRIMEQVEDDLYAVRYSVDIEVALADETIPFLYPSQYVWYDAESDTVETSREVTGELTDEEKIVKACYRFVVNHIAYDTQKAKTVESGYLPNADETLETGKGICFDYSVLLAVMLRSQGIPTRVVIGMVSPENLYHAWNSVYLDGEWVWMDPTLDGMGHRESDYVTERIY